MVAFARVGVLMSGQGPALAAAAAAAVVLPMVQSCVGGGVVYERTLMKRMALLVIVRHSRTSGSEYLQEAASGRVGGRGEWVDRRGVQGAKFVLLDIVLHPCGHFETNCVTTPANECVLAIVDLSLHGEQVHWVGADVMWWVHRQNFHDGRLE